MTNIKKNSIKILRDLEKAFPGDSLVNDLGLSSQLGIDEDTFKLLKKLERSGLISAIAYKTEGLPEEKVLQSPIITPKGIDFLNGLRQKRTNLLLLILTIFSLLGIIAQIIIPFLVKNN